VILQPVQWGQTAVFMSDFQAVSDCGMLIFTIFTHTIFAQPVFAQVLAIMGGDCLIDQTIKT
jgi:hypothetical protein